jgi:uncharacterized membrane protein
MKFASKQSINYAAGRTRTKDAVTSNKPLVAFYFVYLFICGLYNDAVSSLVYMALNDRMINE